MNAIDHLRKLISKGCIVEGAAWDYCFWCEAEFPNDTAHAPDCEWEAAKAHVEEADQNACEVMAIIDEATAACRDAKSLVEEEDAVAKHLDGSNPKTWAKYHGPDPRLEDPRWIKPRSRGFTLIELLVVIVIIVIVSAVALPTVISAMSHRQVSEGARILSAALAGARDAAIRDNSPRGIRLLPDPTLSGLNPTTGLLDPAMPLASNRILPIGSAPDYSEGLLSTWQGPLPANVPALPALMVFQAPADSQGLPTSPTAWFWNVRVGDKIQINKAGPPYTVVGPLVVPAQGGTFTINGVSQLVGNSELFANAGPPGVDPATLPHALKVNGIFVDYLLLVNGHDDNANGWIDEGFDGVDNDVDQELAAGRAAATDDKFEWEQETWLGPAPHQAQTAVPYTIHRRPAPTGNARAVELPSNVVIDLTTWGSTLERSRLPVNQMTGYVDVLVNPNGTVVPTTIYSTPASVGMAGAFYHFWLAERSDIFAPQGTVSPVLPVRPDPGNPQPNRFNGAALKGEYRLVTLFAKTGLTGQLEDMPFDWANVGTTSYFAGAPFVAIQQGAR